MDIVTDLTAQSVSFLTVLQDICRKNGTAIRTLKDDNAYLGDIIDFSKIGQIGNNLEYNDVFNSFRERIQEIIWSSTGEKETGQCIRCFFNIVEPLLGWIHNFMPPIESSIENVPKITGAENGSLNCSPYQWRCIIRTILYQFPKQRINLAKILHYMPLQIILCLDAANLSVYKQRLYQIWEPENAFLLSNKDKANHENWWEMRRQLATQLLDNDSMLLDQLITTNNTVPFETFLNRELVEINKSRLKRFSVDGNPSGDGQTWCPNPPPSSNIDPPGDPIKRAHDMELVGLALSGGGIRSSTFNLGLIQQLAERDRLSRIDYLSTVSGGGYIGAWLISWIKRSESMSKVRDRLNVKKSADPMADEVRPIRWLRMYSNFLTPDSSIMSADSWTVGITWLRNTIINQIILLLLLCTALSTVHFLFRFWIYLSEVPNLISDTNVALWSSMFLLPGALIAGMGMHVYQPKLPPQSFYNLGKHSKLAIVLISWAIVISFFISCWLYSGRLSNLDYKEILSLLKKAVLPIVIAAMVVAVIGNYHGGVETNRKRVFYPAILFSSLVSAVVGVCLLAAVWMTFIILQNDKTLSSVKTVQLETKSTETTEIKRFLSTKKTLQTTNLNTTTIKFSKPLPVDKKDLIDFILGVPLILEVLCIAVVVRMVLLGKMFPDERREWWGRMGAMIHRFIILWLFVTTCVFLLPDFIGDLKVFEYLAGAWTVIVGFAVKLAYSSASEEKEDKSGWTITEVFVRVAPYLFMFGFLLLGVFVLNKVHYYVLPDKYKSPSYHFWLTIALFCITYFLSWRVGVNEFSLHHFYRNRLVRAFLGATRRRTDRSKTANNFTGFDNEDDLKLADLVVEGHYYGPYPLFNTAMNSTTVSELDRQDRKAESFVFTPLFSGFDFSPTRSAANNKTKVYEYGYRNTRMYGYENGPSLGTAMAISGAAVNPNMGYHSSTATAFLLTVFNVRLGWWIGNPRLNRWKRSDPATGLAYIVKDLIGKSDINADYVCLSDGGHFDNMGIYELVRRRCRYIILSDAEEDSLSTCEGLSNAIRRCRIDFGVEIILQTDPVTVKDKNTGFSASRAVKGEIWYPGDVKPSGKILYVKTTLTTNLPTDIREYQLKNKNFPNQSTGDQFFDENQFESYRKLGYHALDGIVI